MQVTKKTENDFYMYRGYPLVRMGNHIFYGNMSDEYVCMVTIMTSHKVKDLNVADKIKVQLSLTKEGVDASEMIIRSSDRNGLQEALDVAYTWLNKTK